MLIVPLFGITIFLSYTLEFDFPAKDFSDNGIYPTYYEDLQSQSEEDFDYNYDLALRGIPMGSSTKYCKEEFNLVRLNTSETGEMYYPRMYLEILCTEMSSASESDNTDNNKVLHRICKRQNCRTHYKPLLLFQNMPEDHNPCWKPTTRLDIPVGCGCRSEY